MATPSAGWFVDPADPARRRYWDGHAWTEYVSSGASVDQAPLEVPAEPPEPEGSDDTPPPPSLSVPSGTPEYPPTLLGRVGLIIVGIGAGIGALAAGSTAARGPIGAPTEVPSSALGLGIAAALVMLAFSFVRGWKLRLAGLGVGALVSAGLALAQLRLRQPERWSDVPLSEITIAPGGVLIGAGATVALAGVALATVCFRRPARREDGIPVPASSRSTLALVTGLAAILVTALGPVAVGLAQTALDDETRSDDALGRRGRARIALRVGYAVIVIFAALVIGIFVQALLA